MTTDDANVPGDSPHLDVHHVGVDVDLNSVIDEGPMAHRGF